MLHRTARLLWVATKQREGCCWPDEKVQSANGQTHKVKCTVANDGAGLTCTQLSERQELAAYDGDDIDGIQGEEANQGMSYVTEDRHMRQGRFCCRLSR